MIILLAALLAQAVPPSLSEATPRDSCAGGLLRVEAGNPCPFLIFFDSGEAEISRDSAATLEQALASWRTGGFTHILLSAHSDRSGSSAGNQRMSRERAETVRHALVQSAIPAVAIHIEAHGESRPIIPTEDGVREPQNRRVEVRLQR